MRAKILLVILAAVGAFWLSASAWAAPTVRLTAGFNPDKLGAATTIGVGFSIGGPAGELPLPLVDVDLHLPAGVIFGSSTLGVARCAPAILAKRGLDGCSRNALVGRGSAIVGIPLGSETLYEPARVTLLMAPLASGHTSILFYAMGDSPVIAQLIFPSLLLDDTGLFGGKLQTSIPPITALPGGPNVALVRLKTTIGPAGLTYYRRARRRLVPYAPTGFGVPPKCPAGGFPFAANFTFEGGTTESAATTVPCPPRGGHSGDSRIQPTSPRSGA